MACIVETTLDTLRSEHRERTDAEPLHFGRGCSLSAERGVRAAPGCSEFDFDLSLHSTEVPPPVLHHSPLAAPDAETAQAEHHCCGLCCAPSSASTQAVPSTLQQDRAHVVASAPTASQPSAVDAVDLPAWVVGEAFPQSSWWVDSLAVEVHQTLREREGVLPPIQFKSPQLAKRQFLVDFLFVVCEQLLLSMSTRFLAIHLMDHFMDKYIVMDYRLRLVALTSLWIAAKFEEREEKVPTMEQLQRLAQLHNSDQGGSPDDTVANSLAASYTREELGKMELYMLKFFNWSVSYSTAVHFSDFFLAHGLNLDISIEGCGVDLGEAKDPILQRVQMEQYNTFFMEAALRDFVFLQWSPSQVAAAAVCATRICVGAPMAWSSELETVTGYHLEDIVEVTDRMLRLVRNEPSS